LWLERHEFMRPAEQIDFEDDISDPTHTHKLAVQVR
jgi:hypothetical protein